MDATSIRMFAISEMPVFAAELAFIVGADRCDNLAPHAQLKRAVNDARFASGAFSVLDRPSPRNRI